MGNLRESIPMKSTFDEQEDGGTFNDWARENSIPTAPPGVFILPGGAVSILESARQVFEVIGPRYVLFT
jgi:hypothetical protein